MCLYYSQNSYTCYQSLDLRVYDGVHFMVKITSGNISFDISLKALFLYEIELKKKYIVTS